MNAEEIVLKLTKQNRAIIELLEKHNNTVQNAPYFWYTFPPFAV